MRPGWLSLFGAFLLLPLPAGAHETASLAIRDAAIVDVTDGIVTPKQTVLIEGSRIRAIGPAGKITVPNDAMVVEASGKYLIPGLMDMHVHLFNNASRRPPSTWAFPLCIYVCVA